MDGGCVCDGMRMLAVGCAPQCCAIFGWNGSLRDPYDKPSTTCTACFVHAFPTSAVVIVSASFFFFFEWSQCRLTQSLCCCCCSDSAWQPPRKASPVGRIRNQIPVYKSTGNFHQPAHFTRVGGPYQDLRWVLGWLNTFFDLSCIHHFFLSCHHCRRHPRTILRPFATLRIWRVPTRSQLPVPRRLRRQRETVPRNHLPTPCLQNQISRKLLHPSG